MRAIVTCNQGYKSPRMTIIKAVIYARQLEDLGNVNVKVRV